MEKNRRRARTDLVFFIEEYLQTFDPRPEAYPHHLDFKLYDFQKDYALEVLAAIHEGRDVFTEKSRDMGASWINLAVRFWLWIFDPAYQGLLGSRKEDYVDNGQIDSLFGKLDYFIDHIKDPLILPEGFDRKQHRLFKKLINPETSGAILGESANKNFSRAGRYTDVIFDEFGFWPDARRSWTAAGDATKSRHAVTTPPDEPSFAKVIRFTGKIKLITLHWSLHPLKDQAWYEQECARRTDEEVLHELDISWEYTATARPYPEADRLTFGNYPYDPRMPLYVSMDLGLDAIAIGWYQPVPNSDWMTLLDAYEVSDELIEWTLPLFGKQIDSRFTYRDVDLEMIERVRYWKDGIFYGDPSGKQRHVESGISPYQILASNGIYVQVNEQENDWPPRRDAAKKVLMRLRVNDTPRTRWWHECVKSARYPKRTEESQSTTPITKPVHDWTSHHRTQTEFFAVNYQPATDDVDDYHVPGY